MRKKELEKKIENLQNRVNVIESASTSTRAIEKLQQQVQCGVVPGHKFVYQKKSVSTSGYYEITYWVFGEGAGNCFVFKCQHCGLEITKTKEQLTTAETAALRALGVIKAEKKKK